LPYDDRSTERSSKPGYNSLAPVGEPTGKPYGKENHLSPERAPPRITRHGPDLSLRRAKFEVIGAVATVATNVTINYVEIEAAGTRWGNFELLKICTLALGGTSMNNSDPRHEMAR
jgi:hypothetical protein